MKASFFRRVFLLFLFPGVLAAQQNWEWVSPREDVSFPPTVAGSAWRTVPGGIGNIRAISGNDGAVVVIGEHGISHSADGKWFQQVFTAGGFNALREVAFGDERFVAVGLSGRIVASNGADGKSWTNVPTSASVNFADVVYGDGVFLAVGSGVVNSAVWASADGSSWEERLSIPRIEIYDLEFGNGVFVMASDGGISSSADGAEWTEAAVPPKPVAALAFSGGRFVAVGEGISGISEDGVAWAWSELGADLEFAAVAGGAGAFWGAGTSFFARSIDGVSWERIGTEFATVDAIFAGEEGLLIGERFSIHSLRSGGYDPSLLSVAIGTGGMVAASDNGGILYSSDGVEWILVRLFNAVDVVYLSGRYVAVGAGGGILVSENGMDWAERESGSDRLFTAVAASPATVVAVGLNGTIRRSLDGETWWTVLKGPGDSPPIGRYLYASEMTHLGVAFAEGIWVAVGYHGVVYVSEDDGETWWLRNVRRDLTLRSVAYAQGRFVAAGEAGIVLTSIDGENWEEREVPLPDIRRIIGGGNFTAVGWDGAVWVSYDGEEWYEQSLPEAPAVVEVSNGGEDTAKVIYEHDFRLERNGWLADIAEGPDGFIAVGSYGTVLTAPKIPVIERHPDSLYLQLGEAADFSVSATSATPVVFQWLKDGEIVGDDTDSLTIPEIGRGSAGVYRVAVSNSGGTALSRVALLTILDDYFSWLEEMGFSEAELADLEVSGPAADPGGFGVPNLLRYVFGLDPRAPDRGGLPAEGIVTLRDAGETSEFLTMTYRQKAGATGVSFFVEASGDLVEWERLAPDYEISRESDGVVETVTVRDSVPVGEENGKRFLRLMVQLSD